MPTTHRTDGNRPARTARTARRRAGTAAALLATACTAFTVAPQAPAASAAPPSAAVQRNLDRLVADDGFPAALASVRDRSGRVVNLTAGTGNLATGARVPVDGRVRAGSNTKTFTAVVVLQLVGEGKVRLDEPVETYLPGLLRGPGGDGRAVTVRQLLQHTSGLPNYTALLGVSDLLEFGNAHWEHHELLDLALAQPAEFAPGQGWSYSNTNYVVAGLLVQKVTGRPLAVETTERVIRRLGLRGTYVPDLGERGIRGKHPRGYHASAPGGEMVDATELDASVAWAAGDVVSTPSDLNRVFLALLDGDLLRPQELAEMRRTVPAPNVTPGDRAGLGIFSTPLSCGGLAWGHGGDIPGYETRGGVTEDGRAVTVAVTALPGALREPEAGHQHVVDAVDAALCR
ncbi:serine hydrolase domain-containing protein [Kineococcus sp. NUM-3379]